MYGATCRAHQDNEAFALSKYAAGEMVVAEGAAVQFGWEGCGGILPPLGPRWVQQDHEESGGRLVSSKAHLPPNKRCLLRGQSLKECEIRHEKVAKIDKTKIHKIL